MSGGPTMAELARAVREAERAVLADAEIDYRKARPGCSCERCEVFSALERARAALAERAAPPEPHPLAGVVAEVLAHPLASTPAPSGREALGLIYELSQAQDGKWREVLVEIVATGIAGIAACDGAKGGAT